jgi:hypothetical protein
LGKVYFGSEAEKAIRDYLKEEDLAKKQKIYLIRIQPAFTKLVENIINMPKFNFKKLGEFQSLHNEVMAHLYFNLERFNPRRLSKKTRKRVKAFSYFGTVAKNYLVQQSIRASKTDYLHEDHEGNEIDISTLPLLATESLEAEIEMKEFFELLIEHFEKERESYQLDKKKVGDSITYFLKNVEKETVFNKKHFYLILREMTGLTAKQITSILNEFKQDYQKIRAEYNNGNI